MKITQLKKFTFLTYLAVTFLLINSCATDRPKGYALQSEVWNKDEDDSVTKIYITSTMPIDSVDQSKLAYDIFRIETDEYPDKIKIYARVFDSLGHFVTNMADPYKKFPKENYFTSMTEWLGKIYNRRMVNIDSFKVREFGAKDSIPYNIVMSVDYSGSMSAVKEVIFEGTEIFVNLKMPYDQIGLTSFNNNIDVKSPLIRDGSRIISLYNVNKNRGFGLFSAVYHALDSCMNMFAGTPLDVPRVLVVFSDGDDNYSKDEIGDLYQKAKDNKIHIFSVAFGYSKDDNLRALAKHTGGKFYKAYSKKELIDIFRDIYMSLRYYYYITYKPPKYWGWHDVIAGLNVPIRKDTIIAKSDYDTGGMFDFAKLDSAFKRPILFDFDSSVVKPESYPIIDELVDAMMSYPKLMLEVQGHTDKVGTEEYNMKLSEARAQAVMYELTKRGIDPRRLRARGFGMSEPVASNDTEVGRAQNRRTMFKILAK